MRRPRPYDSGLAVLWGLAFVLLACGLTTGCTSESASDPSSTTHASPGEAGDATTGGPESGDDATASGWPLTGAIPETSAGTTGTGDTTGTTVTETETDAAGTWVTGQSADTTAGDDATTEADTNVDHTSGGDADSNDADNDTDTDAGDTGSAVCGDNVLEDPEVCDREQLGGETCMTRGFESGQLACADDCQAFDESDCIPFCVPECGGRTCGPDPECGESCGMCGANETCTDQGACVPTTGTGFSRAFTDWSVPSAQAGVGIGDGFFAQNWSAGAAFWRTLDINGDDLPDLVWTAEPTNDGGYDGVVWGLAEGNPHWRVHLNTGSGFEREATAWPVPRMDSAVVIMDGFFAADWSAGAAFWSTFDINGDSLPDLVWTAEPTNEDGYDGHVWGLDTANPHWRVYLNTGTGFAREATEWSMPAAVGGVGISDGFFARTWSAGAAYWSTFDIDGDALPDFIWTAEPVNDDGYDGEVWGNGSAQPHWRVYRNTGTGFSRTPSEWRVPVDNADIDISDGFFAASWAAGAAYWSTFDIDTDGLPDFIWTAEPVNDGGYDGVVWGGRSNPHWRVYLNQGSGFSGSPLEWPVPFEDSELGISDGFFAPAWSAGAAYWNTFDIDGDGAVDFVWTAEPINDGGYDGVVWGGRGNPYWRVYLNRGDGFSRTAHNWQLPRDDADIAISDGFFATAWGAGAAYWSTLDLNGDARPDFVWTAEPTMDNGYDGVVWGVGSQPHWRMALNQ